MEIHNQQFKKALRGFDQEEVKEFLEIIAEDYEALFVENAQLKEAIQRLEHEMSKYRKMEESINNSLILAQQTADNIKTNAQLEAEKLISDARGKVTEVFILYQDVIKRLNMLNLELKGQVAAQMEILEKNQEKVEKMSEYFFSRDMKEIMVSIEKVEP
jgi:cell division initiation protein